jgi:hypothetical protein
MLPTGITKAALVASLLLGTSALAQAQTHENAAGAPATGPATSSAPAAPGATQAEPQKPAQAVPQKSTQAEPQKPAQAEPERSTQAAPQQPGATKPSDVTGRGNPAAEATPNRTGGRPDTATSGSSTEAGRTPAGAGAGGSNATASTVNLTTTQKTEIHNTIINNSSAPRATNLNISLSVGVAVPEAVQFAPLPANIVLIEPAWRGYEYFVYGEQIVIIEPGTRRIVAVLVS